MDPVHFSSEEILDMAIRIEENGERFYKAAAASAKNPKLKSLFELLVKEEIKHAAYFNKIKKSVAEYSSHGNADPYVDEASLYIKALSDSKVFKPAKEASELSKEAAADERKAVDFAIDAEKESLLFYYELQKAVRDNDKKIVDDIIREEKDHLQRLTDMKKEIFG